MTKKLYYQDAYMTKFIGKILSCEEGKKGIEVVLDQTAFYPEGGGQPADMGILGDAKVSYVFIKDEVIYHVVDKALEVGAEVEGVIDFERRFDFMQQHSGEHIFSGLVNAKYGYHNVGFHLSGDYMTCDFDGELTREQVEALEALANESVYKNLVIECSIYNDQEIKEKPYRSKLDLVGDVRLVTVPDYDTCACCGTHVKATGEIGMIKCTNVERHRGGTRITMLCGKRVLKDAQQKQQILAEVSKMLSAKPEVITSNLSKLQDELTEMKQKVAILTNELMELKSVGYLETTEPAICIYEKDLVGDAIRRLCLMLMEKTNKIILVLSGEGQNIKYALAAKEIDVRPLNQCLMAQFKGKGGGKREMCQGNLVGDLAEIRAYYLLHHEIK